jgi:hypothetical protein
MRGGRHGLSEDAGVIEGHCHCGAVTIRLTRAPSEVTDCNCSICRRLGVLWAYYPTSEVEIGGEEGTLAYAWGDKSLTFHTCTRCGCTSHWKPVGGGSEFSPAGRMGINARLLDPQILAAARVEHLDGADTWASTYDD